MLYCPDCGTRQIASRERRSRLRGSRGRHPVSHFVITETRGDVAVEVPWNRMVRVGRHPSTDLTLLDGSVSRFHAELITTEDGCVVRDLDSSNGTFVNGVSVRELTLRDGDEMRFGSVTFRVREMSPEEVRERPAKKRRRRPKPRKEVSIEHSVDMARSPRLGVLMELAQALARQDDTEKILEALVEHALDMTGADRASIAFAQGDEISTGVYRARKAAPQAEHRVPRSIARHCLTERVAVLTESADTDERFQGDSIVTLGVRSAMCVPIIARDGHALGVCYVDQIESKDPFRADDLSYLVALTGIAVAALNR
jgi:pSer/pThr/pTyr-binding forkhead associated (FHA) protein